MRFFFKFENKLKNSLICETVTRTFCCLLPVVHFSSFPSPQTVDLNWSWGFVVKAGTQLVVVYEPQDWWLYIEVFLKNTEPWTLGAWNAAACPQESPRKLINKQLIIIISIILNENMTPSLSRNQNKTRHRSDLVFRENNHLEKPKKKKWPWNQVKLQKMPLFLLFSVCVFECMCLLFNLLNFYTEYKYVLFL